MAAAAVMRPEEERLFHGQPKGFPLGDFAVEDVMLPEVLHETLKAISRSCHQLVQRQAACGLRQTGPQPSDCCRMRTWA